MIGADAIAAVRRRVEPIWRRPWVRRSIIAVLVGLSLVFLALAVRDASSSDILRLAEPADLAAVLACSVIYVLLLVLLARSWALAPGTATPGIGYVLAIAVYGTSILPKYIPGSVLQYGSRQYLGQRLGWNAALVARGSLLEIILHVLCSLAVALALLTLSAGQVPQAEPWWVVSLTAAVAGFVAALLIVGSRLKRSVIVLGALYQLAFFTGMAGLAMICALLFGVAADRLTLVGGLFLLSWLIGFLVPLVPGGLGVREASGVAMLSGAVGVEAALLILAAMRIISLGGDVLMFAAGMACRRALKLGA